MKHILIDYENIQPTSFAEVETDNCHIWLFLGINQQKSLPLDLVEALLQFHHQHIHIIKMQHAGKNALDFYLSFYLGKISERDPQAEVCIIARDSGYDVLVEHLNATYHGMSIVRLADTKKLSLKNEWHNTSDTISEVTTTPPLIQKQVNELSGTVRTSDAEDSLETTQSFDETIPRSVIHDCYVLVFDNIVNQRVFLPKYKSNLLYWIKQYVPATLLESYNHNEQDFIFEKVFDKFLKAGLICFDDKNEKLIYKVDNQGILNLIIDKVLLSKAKTRDGLNNVIKQKLANYRQNNSEDQVNLVVTWLKNQGLIQQDNQHIYYPALNQRSTEKSNQGLNSNYQRALTSLKNRPISTRPAKKSSLINHLNSHLRHEAPSVIDTIIKQMVNNNVITISNTDKISYLV